MSAGGTAISPMRATRRPAFREQGPAKGELAGEQHREARGERQQVEDRAVGEDRAEHQRGGRARQQHDEHGFEHAQAAGHLAHRAGDQRQDVDAHELRPGERHAGREDRVQGVGGAQPVGHGSQHLRYEAGRPGSATESRPSCSSPARQDVQQRVRRDYAEEDDSDRTRGEEGDVQHGRQADRVGGEDDPADEEEPGPQRDGAESDDAGDFAGGQTPRRVQTVPYRAAGQDPEAGHIPDADAGHGRLHGLPPAEGMPGVAGAEPVVHGDGQVAQDRGRDGEQDGPRGKTADGVGDLVGMEGLQLAVQEPEREAEDEEPGCHAEAFEYAAARRPLPFRVSHAEYYTRSVARGSRSWARRLEPGAGKP